MKHFIDYIMLGVTVVNYATQPFQLEQIKVFANVDFTFFFS